MKNKTRKKWAIQLQSCHAMHCMSYVR